MGAPKAGKFNSDWKEFLPQARRAANLLKQVSDATRVQVISMLSEGEMYVGAVCRELNERQPAVSHHLALLRHSGSISPRRQGKNTFYSLTKQGELLSSVVKEICC